MYICCFINIGNWGGLLKASHRSVQIRVCCVFFIILLYFFIFFQPVTNAICYHHWNRSQQPKRFLQPPCDSWDHHVTLETTMVTLPWISLISWNPWEFSKSQQDLTCNHTCDWWDCCYHQDTSMWLKWLCSHDSPVIFSRKQSKVVARQCEATLNWLIGVIFSNINNA